MLLTRLWRHVVDPADPVDGEDDEAAAAAHLDDDGDELGVGGAEGRVVRVARDAHVLVAARPLRRRAVHVAELGRADALEDGPAKGLLHVGQIKLFIRAYGEGGKVTFGKRRGRFA